VSRRLNVAIVSDAVAPFHLGGKETRYEELISRLAAHDVDVTICTMRWWSDSPPDDEESGARHIRWRALCRRWPLYRADGTRSFVQAAAFSLGCLRLVRGRYDVIEADHMPGPQLITLRIVATLKRVPLQASWHEVWGREYWRAYLPGIGGIVGALVEAVSSRCPDRILANSRGTAARLIDVLGVDPSRVRLVENGVDLAGLARCVPTSGADLLYAGRLIEHKRVDVLLRALELLHERGEAVRLDIIGDGPARSALEELCAELGLADHVRFLGSLATAREVWSHMKGARVFVSASEREGFGLSVIESMAMGVPAVVADHPDNEARHFVTGDGGSCATPGDAADFAAHIAALLERDRNPVEVSERFLQKVPGLNWDRCASLFADACHGRAASQVPIPA